MPQILPNGAPTRHDFSAASHAFSRPTHCVEVTQQDHPFRWEFLLSPLRDSEKDKLGILRENPEIFATRP